MIEFHEIQYYNIEKNKIIILYNRKKQIINKINKVRKDELIDINIILLK